MEKILKKYTTIPQHLYVERNADIQLKRIIEEMQRPGYVLVARQMGKTNLLINAKRTLENETRLFAYVDLSNLYSKERDCYRNIINCIIEPNINQFISIEQEIEKIRTKNLPPHNEYSRSLISILNHLKGDLVIILDEIDALKSIEYSDNIFAQIRSNYFSRTNFPEFERLTYVLSGVIEPTELIKDKNKSPFNIGDKIYLDDFSRDEFNSFINKSQLNIDNEVKEETFKWTNGNPRLTFDVCAEIESHLIAFKKIAKEDVKKIITSKYLDTYDIAPIDHIRELVKSNREIRKAIVNIYNRQIGEINDDIKRKLYLYGIIGSNYYDNITIKNKIIEESLSLEWIKAIDKVKEANYLSGLTKYSEKSYVEALEIFEEIINKSENEQDKEGTYYFAGMSAMKLGVYDKALEYFSFNFDILSYKDDALAFLGVCQIAVGEYSQGLITLETAIQQETNSHGYQNALLNLAINEKNTDKSLSLLEKLYNSTFQSLNSEKEELDQLRALSLYYQSDIYRRKEDNTTAILKINEALENSNVSNSLILMFTQCLLNKSKNSSIKHELVKKIINNKLKFEIGESNPIGFVENHLYLYLNWVFDRNNPQLFKELLDYATTFLIKSISKYEIALIASRTAIINKKEILLYLINHENEISEDILIDIYREICSSQPNITEFYTNIFRKYSNLFTKNDSITIVDIYVFATYIKNLADSNSDTEALRLCDLISSKLKSAKEDNLVFESLIIYYWYANLYYSQKNKAKALEFADITIKIIKDSNGKKMSMIDDAGLGSIKEQMNKIKFASITRNPFINENKIGRNDKVKVKYKDGNEVEKKFKQVISDINSGLCEIIG